MPFDTVNDPRFFLTRAYGPGYMTPRPRRSVSMNFSAATKAMLKHVDKDRLRAALDKFAQGS
ncbi:hypothetical protein GQ600_3592 [Phytophthora cactorum]|nr:hypothetical protein GQ600_3592 [Phytophthora cactorum]